MQLKDTIILSVEDIMTADLLQIRTERTQGEFCWTCTPVVIEYVMTKYKEAICTYIDADIYFFASPEDALQEMLDSGSSVGVVPHRFERDYAYGSHIFSVGKYCIQFNTFLNDENGLLVLEDWKKNCLQWCYKRYEDDKYGDQKYPDKWKQKYACIYEFQNIGAGVAPWNLHLYLIGGKQNEKIWMKYRKKDFQLIFYHFEGMKYLKSGRIFLNIWRPAESKMGKKIGIIYGEYFMVLASIRNFLATKYQITFKHLLIDGDAFEGNMFSIRQFCKENGLLNGIRKWAGYWKNNMFQEKI